MRIVIDARMITNEMHGIARYTYNLADRLTSIDPKNEYILLAGNDCLAGFAADRPNCRLERVRSKFISIAEQVELPLVLKGLRADLFHSPSFVAPLFCPCRLIMTVHDVNHMLFPQYYGRIHQLYYRHIVRPSVLKAQKILTVSCFSRSEIIKFLGVSPEKIIVTYNGIDRAFKVIDKLDILKEVRSRYRLPAKFILYVGNRKPHKNVQRLIEAFSKLSTDFSLVLIGKADRRLVSQAENMGLTGRLVFTGDVTENDLPVLYNLAGLFVFPSLYEGFGLPPLEAMACGTPVITSNRSSLPEVAGEAAALVDPYSSEELAAAIDRVLKDEGLCRQMRENGLLQAAKFSWEETARQTLEVYEEVLEGQLK
ncbi:glycosyltransferase family 4 protein [Phosphitispora sp. TUW77]|uniref:glycosyltransferase family 4 protein n=1 Tax=Phosphitispora sp. TUW77 TaxID=3152361 RepID=UPI003AB605D6